MKRVVYICIISLCLMSFAFAQGAKPGRTTTHSRKVKQNIASPFAEAEKAWIPFWQNFRELIKNQNYKRLYEVMVADFDFNACDTNYGRDLEIKKFMPDAVCSGWDELQSIVNGKVSALSKTTEGRVVNRDNRIYKTPLRTVSDNKKSGPCVGENSDWFALFEYSQGAWYFVALNNCEHGE